MKKTLLTTLSLVLILVATSTVNAQEKYALFIHGFGGDESSWVGPDIQVPQQWKAEGIITDYIAISYETSKLGSKESQAALLNSIGLKMNTMAATGEWIIVGHSLGGILARVAYNYLKLSPAFAHLNITAITTVGTPSQGANSAHVALTSLSGYKNVAPELNAFKKLVVDPLPYIHSISGAWASSFVDNFFEQIDNLPPMLDEVFEYLAKEVNTSTAIPAKDLIGRVNLNGNNENSLIFLINQPDYLKPAHIRSIIGAEKQFTVVRSISEIKKIGNERSTLSAYNSLIGFYNNNAGWWDAQAFWESVVLKFGSAKSSRRKRDLWNKGHAELNNIDKRWGSIIDAYKYIPTEQVLLVPDGQCDNGGGPVGIYNIQQTEIPADYTCISGVLYKITIQKFYVLVATKNDGLLTPESCVWDPGSSLTNNPKNHYYDDVSADGGYNHFELKRYKRNYESKDVNLNTVFRVGDYAPPMRDAARWIELNYQNGK